MKDKNVFGGGNPNSLYVPLSELEQEAVSRLVESGDLNVHIVGWGVVHRPRVTFGDARIKIAFQAEFDRPEVPIPVHHLDLELRTGAGKLLYGPDRLPTEYNGNPIQVAAGVCFGMEWHILVRSIDPKLVKELVPGAVGLTSRLQDKDTGEMTTEGNMRLDARSRRLLRVLRAGEDAVRGRRGPR